MASMGDHSPGPHFRGEILQCTFNLLSHLHQKQHFFHMEKFTTIWNIRVQGIKKKERMQVKHHITDFAYHPSFRNVSREKLHYCCMLSA
jgi:hypothetical protein